MHNTKCTTVLSTSKCTMLTNQCTIMKTAWQCTVHNSGHYTIRWCTLHNATYTMPQNVHFAQYSLFVLNFHNVMCSANGGEEQPAEQVLLHDLLQYFSSAWLKGFTSCWLASPQISYMAIWIRTSGITKTLFWCLSRPCSHSSRIQDSNFYLADIPNFQTSYCYMNKNIKHN